jgi:cholesterol oxidase
MADRKIPLFTLEGVKNADITTYPFSTGDGLGISMLRFLREPCDDVVILVHGLTTSTDMFIMPEHENLVTYLHDHGFTDVWSLDNRMSMRHIYNLRRHRMNMDDVALHDYPPALELIREHVGDRRIHVIAHCLGSVTFSMSLFGGAVSGISSLIANSVSLILHAPLWTRIKLAFAPFMVDYILGVPYLNPRWSEDPGITIGKIFSKVVDLVHRECPNSNCHMLSMMWGAGFPALYEHANMADVTHDRCGDLFGATSMNYQRHVRKCTRSGNQAVKYLPGDPRYASLPDNYWQDAKDIETPILFSTGTHNRVFLDSNVRCFDRIDGLAPGRHEKQLFPGYGHQDPFMGKNAAADIFPHFLRFLEKHRT